MPKPADRFIKMIKNTVVVDNKNQSLKNDFVFSLEGKDLRYTVQMTVFYWLVKTFFIAFHRPTL